MKIKSGAEAGADVERVRQRQSGKAGQNKEISAESKNAGAALKSDTVEVDLGRQIADIASGRADRVAQIKALVESGKYNPDSKKIADAVGSYLDDEILFDNLENL